MSNTPQNEVNDDKLSESLATASSSNSMSSSTVSLNQQNDNNNTKYNISNVLKHIYALKYVQKSNQNIQSNNGNGETVNNSDNVSISSNNPNNTANTGDKQFWMPDDQVKECFECNDKFTTFRRRHVNIFFCLLFIFNINN